MQYKKILPYTFLAWLSIIQLASAQTDKNKKISLSGQFSHDIRFKNWYFSAPQIGLGWQNKKHNWHELDLTEALLSKSSEHHILSAGLRYQYSIMPFKRFENTRFKPFLGIGATAASSHSLTQVNAFTNYDIRHFTTTFRAHISPGIEYNFSKRFYGSFQLPISLISLRTVDSRLFDPNLSAEDQKRSTTNLRLFPMNGVEARLSIGYKF